MKTSSDKRGMLFLLDRCYHFAQHKWADKMNSLVQGLSRRKLIWLLVLFVLCSGSCLLWIVYVSFS